MILQPLMFTVLKAAEWDHETLRSETEEKDDEAQPPEMGELK